jgi:mannose-6-phosphate isomerase
VAVERGIIGDVDLGLNLAQLIDKYKGLLVGEKVYKKFGNTFPLLVKFIDSRQDLSVQVHPDDKLAQKRHKCPGKTEMWYVVKADVGAKIYSGLKESITPEDYERLATAEPVNGHSPMQDVIATHEAHQGDLYFLPAGRLHAIGAGNFLVEIQQTSDITYRIYDYGRLGLDGKPRELHTELAKDAIDYTVKPDYRTGYQKSLDRESILVRCPYFTTSLFDLTEPFTKDLHNIDSFLTVICVEGSGVLRCVEPAPMREIRSFGFRRRAKALTEPQLVEMPVRQGETVLVPACVPSLEFIPDDIAGCRAIPAAEKNPDGECCRNSIGSPAAPAPHFKLLTSYIA